MESKHNVTYAMILGKLPTGRSPILPRRLPPTITLTQPLTLTKGDIFFFGGGGGIFRGAILRRAIVGSPSPIVEIFCNLS